MLAALLSGFRGNLRSCFASDRLLFPSAFCSGHLGVLLFDKGEYHACKEHPNYEETFGAVGCLLEEFEGKYRSWMQVERKRNHKPRKPRGYQPRVIGQTGLSGEQEEQRQCINKSLPRNNHHFHHQLVHSL